MKGFFYRKSHRGISKYLSLENELMYCNNIQTLIETGYVGHEPQQYKICTVLSTIRLKAVYIHNGKVQTLIRIGYASHMK